MRPMRVRTLLLWLTFGAVAGAAQTAPGAKPQPPKPPAPQAPAPQTQKPVFRTGVELLTVDATVVDRDGRQVIDLTASEFVVEVDGNPRPVVTAEYVKLVDTTPVIVGAPKRAAAAPVEDPYFSTNTRGVSRGRLIVLLVDEGNIRMGQGRDIMRSAAKFVDGLSPGDRVALAAIPRGPLVDFTEEHEKVREGLMSTVGRATAFKGRFYMSLSEAIAAYEHSDSMLRNQLILRECAAVLNNPVEATRCEIEVEQEAGEFVNHQRQQTQASLHGMRELLRSLDAVEGPKSVILISEGLVLEGLGSDVDEIAAIAADARASLDVMLLDVPVIDVSVSQRPTTPREDREKQVSGLEMLAGAARGGLHRIVASSDNAFGRILRSISGYYLIAVEARPLDRDGRRHKISVKTSRRGVTLYSRRGFLAPMSAAASSPGEAVTRALRAPLTMNDVRMRLATWTYKEPASAKVRLLVTAEIERSSDQALEYTAGFVVVDRNNRGVATTVEPRTLRESENNPGVAIFAGSLLLDPGTYLLRFAAVDSEGRIGSVDRKFDAWQMNAKGLTVGDLLIGQRPESAGGITPAIEPVVGNGQLAALMEVYAPALATSELQATLEVFADETAKPLLSGALDISVGRSPEIGVLQGVMNMTALPPGRYLARATVRQAGKPQGHLTRPFRVVAPTRAANDAGAAAPARLPAELMAAMLAGLPAVDSKELVAPAVLTTVLTAAETSRPAAKAAFASARTGGLGPAALEALSSGDQAAAAFLRGVDFFAQGQNDRAVQQLQIAMQQAPTFAPTRLYLGAALAQGNRHREAASLLQSVGADLASLAPVARMAATSWLRAGEAANAVASLEQAHARGDAAVARTLALAYLAANRAVDAVPLLARHLEANPKDSDSLLAGLYATYSSHLPSARMDTLATDRARAQGWAKAYAAQKGEHQALVDAWMKYLQDAK
jgi:VWFA-related protein